MTDPARSRPVDGFRLAYDVDTAAAGGPPAVLLLHGWPGSRRDHRHVAALLSGRTRTVVPDLRGFGESDKHPGPPLQLYSAAAQARSVLALLDELGVERAVIGGYDVGSRVAQEIVRSHPERMAGLVLTPPLPGAGERLLAPSVQQQFWYQALHRLPLAVELLDGRPDAVRAYLRHFWEHWSGPGFRMDPQDLDRLVELYGAPGAFTASIAWYRSRPGPASSAGDRPPAVADRLATPVEVLWPALDPLFPADWADRLDQWYADARVTVLPDVGHFVPVEAPAAFADAVERLLERVGRPGPPVARRPG
ncbi:alpha/beta fold hydrolase [Nakamurella endophytica]|uniref:Hydrolase n=1 Tax=Nakamurella endophytica TaxID=1748367 RepID=A0A917SLA5_9ACTN|nr:alpha/beta hydrolase [Nakamurella endophytica]GGL85267.1 hydrolase [Nakamurella endophytica]